MSKMRLLSLFLILFCMFAISLLSFYYYLVFNVYKVAYSRHNHLKFPSSIDNSLVASNGELYEISHNPAFNIVQSNYGQLKYSQSNGENIGQSIATEKSLLSSKPNCPSNLLSMANRLRVRIKSQTLTTSEIMKQVTQFKNCLTYELKKRQIQSTNVLYYPQVNEDRYGIKSKTSREKINSPSLDQLCKIKFVTIDTRSYAINIWSTNLIEHLPSKSLTSAIFDAIKSPSTSESINPFMSRADFNLEEGNNAINDDISCALVSSAGSLIDSQLGSQIDSHDIVLRFNDAPSGGKFAKDVGSKTTIRIINSKFFTSSSFNISSLTGEIFLTWDPFQYVPPHRMHPVVKSIKSDFSIIDSYRKIRSNYPEKPFYMIDPYTVWRLYDELSLTTMKSLPKTPPTSGFIGLSLLLNVCSYVHAYEYIPSMRMNELCHYYSDPNSSNGKSLGCTLGDWHPVATEKLYAISINTASDDELIVNGTALFNSCDN